MFSQAVSFPATKPRILGLFESLKLNKDITDTLIMLLITLGGYSFKLFLNLFLAKTFSPVFYGNINIVLKVLNALSSLSLLGTTVSAKRFLSQYIHHNDESSILGFIGWNIRVILLMFLVVFTLTVLFEAGVYFLHDLGYQVSTMTQLVAMALFIIPLYATCMLISSYLACSKKPIAGYALVNLVKYAMLFGFLLLVSLCETKVALWQIPVILSITFISLTIIGGYLLRKTLPVITKISFKKLLSKEYEVQKQWGKVSAKVLFNTSSFLLLCVLDLLMVRFFSDKAHDVGYYSAAMAVSSVFWVLARGLFQFLKINVSTLIKTHCGKIKLQKHLKILNITLILTCGVLVFFIYLFANPILLGFGKDYLAAKQTLFLVILAAVIGVFGQSGLNVLLYSGFEQLVLKLCVLELIILVSLGVPLTLAFGINGTAISLILSVLFKTLCLIYFAKAKTKIASLVFI